MDSCIQHLDCSLGPRHYAGMMDTDGLSKTSAGGKDSPLALRVCEHPVLSCQLTSRTTRSKGSHLTGAADMLMTNQCVRLGVGRERQGSGQF